LDPLFVIKVPTEDEFLATISVAAAEIVIWPYRKGRYWKLIFPLDTGVCP
jgi:hypothetical protein